MIVIKRSNLPIRLPIFPTAVAFLLLDRFHAVGWVWGAVGTVFLLAWIGIFVAWVKEDEVELDGLLKQCPEIRKALDAKDKKP